MLSAKKPRLARSPRKISLGFPDHELARGHEKGWSYFLELLNEQFGDGSRKKYRWEDAHPRAAMKESAPSVQAEFQWKGKIMNSRKEDTEKIHGYAPVNNLKMYYEMEGTGDPLVYIPPAFEFAGLKSFPALTENHRVITVDLQGNGRTADIPERLLSIEQYAQDVVGLLKYLGIAKADFFGESYGGHAAALIAIRHPELVGRVVTYGATFGLIPTALDPKTTHYMTTRLTLTPSTSNFRERITRRWHPIQVTGPGFMTRSAPFSGTDFRSKS